MAVALAYEAYLNGNKIYSNMESVSAHGKYASPEAWALSGDPRPWVNRPAWATYLENPKALMALEFEDNAYVLIDEIWAWLESRGSGVSSTRTELTHTILQSRHAGWHLIATLQLVSSVDTRVRHLINYLIIARKLMELGVDPKYEFCDLTKTPPVDKVKTWSGYQWVYPLYDTREHIETVKDKKKRRKRSGVFKPPKARSEYQGAYS